MTNQITKLRQLLSRLIWSDDYQRLQECAKCFEDMLDHLDNDGERINLKNVNEHTSYLSEHLLPFLGKIPVATSSFGQGLLSLP